MRTKISIMCVVVSLSVVLTANAATIEVFPTGTVADIGNVRAAIASAQPGNVIVLKAGTFNWAGNSVAVPPFVVPFGLPITVSNITITGEISPSGDPLTTILGPVEADGFPQVYGPFPAENAAFVNAPGVIGVTIRNLALRNLEVAISLIQSPSTGLGTQFVPGGDFSSGADDFVIEQLRIENSLSGLQGLGANDRLTIRNNKLHIVAKDGLRLADRSLIGNATGIANLSQAPLIPDAPADVLIENNFVLGPGPDL